MAKAVAPSRAWAISIPIHLILILCCALPLGWLCAQLAFRPALLTESLASVWGLKLLARTLSYNLCAGLLATLLALPAAVVLGRGRGWLATLLWLLLPASLLLPSLAYTYGWSQFLRLLAEPLGDAFLMLPAAAQRGIASAGIVVERMPTASGGHTAQLSLVLAGPADVARCVWSLATWLCPLSAGIVGLSLRRLDPGIQQQALLDGVFWRVTARQLAAPIAASIVCVTILASQEFAVYEPTGISVVATELRMIFQTGFASSPQNSITAPMSGAYFSATDQATRAASSVAAALPLLLSTLLLAIAAILIARRATAAEAIDTSWPAILNAGRVSKILALLVLFIAVVVPMGSMVLAHQRRFDLSLIMAQSGPEVGGSLFLGALTGGVACAVGLGSVVSRRRWTLPLGLLTFLVGGQLLAIAMIRLYNHPGLGWVYDAPPIMVMTYFARFGWLALLAAGATFSLPWRNLRELANLDGAGPLRTAVSVVWPLAWPSLLAAALLVMVLSVTEVPATVLISPLRPEPIVPKLMTWVHILQNDPMIEASLLLVGVSMALGLLIAAIALAGRRLRLGWAATPLVLALISGCGHGSEPQESWCETGTGPAQLVYPRAIAYRPQDDSFVVIDRVARVQRLDRHGGYLNEWRMPDWQTGKPVGVSVGPDGNVYVPDTHYHRVIVYSPDGKEIRRWGSMGKAPGEFIFPTDVAFDAAGHVFVSEYGDNDRVQVFDATGGFLYAFGKFGSGDGEFSRPQSMVIDGDTIYITDACNHRIQVFTTAGKFVRTMGSLGTGLGQFRFPYGLAEDHAGRLIVAEFGNNRVQLVDKLTGRGLATWGSAGHEPGRLAYPWAAAVDRRNRVVAVDSGNNRLQVFEF